MKTKALHSGFLMLIIVFTAVCLFTFASIVLVSAKQTQKQSDMIVERQIDYYKACSNAETAIAESLGKNGTYERTFIINEEETLHIQYTVLGDSHRIQKWQVIDISDWTPDNHMNLLD